MNRRILLQRAAAVALGPVLPSLAGSAAAQPKAPRHRVRPSDPAWPDAASWARLNQDVGGRLIKVSLPLDLCRSALQAGPPPSPPPQAGRVGEGMLPAAICSASSKTPILSATKST